MGMTGENTTHAAVVICPSCGEQYNSPERVTEVLRNSGFCINLTCLHDLTHQPFDAILALKREGRRSADRRVS